MENDHRQTGGPGQVIPAPPSDRLDAAGRALAALTAAAVLAVVILVVLDAWHRNRSLPLALVRCLAVSELVLAPAGTRSRHPQLTHSAVELRHAPNLPPLPAGLFACQPPDIPPAERSSREP